MDERLETADEDEADLQHGKYLTFLLGKEVFGVEIQYVTEIVGIQKINALPEAPNYMKGIINLRGKIIPVIDMRLRFKRESIPYTDRTCIIVIDIMDMAVGLIVDRVLEVIAIPDASVVPPPDFHVGFRSRYLKGIEKSDNRIRFLLDCEQLFQSEEIEAFNRVEAY